MLIDDAAKEYINKVIHQNNYLKISVAGGGCSGYHYIFDSVGTLTGEHVIIDNRVAIDKRSYVFLKNSTLTYKQTLGSSILTIVNPDAKTTCGCGESFGL